MSCTARSLALLFACAVLTMVSCGSRTCRECAADEVCSLGACVPKTGFGGASGAGGDGGAAHDSGVGFTGESCDEATPLLDGVPVMGSTTFARDDYRLSTLTSGCRSTNGGGRDVVYRLEVGPGQLLSVGVVPTSPWDVVLNLVAGLNCGSGRVGPTVGISCVAGADGAPAGLTAESAGYANTGTQPVEVFVVVDGFGDGEAGEFVLVATRTNVASPAGDVCASALPLPSTASRLSLASFASDYSGQGSGDSCRYAPGADCAFVTVAQANQRIEVTATPDPLSDLSLSVVRGPPSSCNARSSCLTAANRVGTGAAEKVVFNSPVADTYFVIVDSSDSNAGSFALTTTTAPTPAGDLCGTTGPPLTSATTLSQNFTDVLDDYAFRGTGCGDTPVDGPDRAYAVLVPAGRRVRATVSGTAASLQLVSSCAGRSCLASSSSTVSWENTGATPAAVWLIVDSSDGTSGAFTLDVAFESTPGPASGDTCSTAGAPVVTSTQLGLQSLAGALPSYDVRSNTGCQPVDGGADRVYAVTVEPGWQLEAQASAVSAGLNLILNLMDGPASTCMTTSACLASADFAASGGGETLSWVNRGATAQTVFVMAAAFGQPSSVGTFDLRIGLQRAGQLGESCSYPGPPINSSTTLSGLNLAGFMANHVFDATDGCRVTPSSVDRVHQLVVPAGAEVTATVVPQGFDAVLNLVEQATPCNALALCLDSADTSVSSQETVAFVNTGAVPVTLNLVVSAFNMPTSSATYSLSVAIRPQQDRCEAPGPLVVTATSAQATWQGLSATYAFSTANQCRATAMGVDRVHAVRIPAGRQLVAGLATAVDGVLNVVAAPEALCSQNRCLGSADRGSVGSSETATVPNFGSAAQDVFVIASAFGQSTSNATYTLNIQLPQVGETCTTPAPLAALPVTLMAQSTTNHSKDHTLGSVLPCRASTGPDVVYSVTVPVGRTLTISVASAADAVLNLVSASSTCTAVSSCLAGVNSGGPGASEMMMWANGGAGAQDVLVLVSNAAPAPMTYTLSAELR